MNNLYTAKKQDKYRVTFIVVLLLVVLCSCILIGTVTAWLTRTYTYNDSDNVIGSVEMKLYVDNQEVTGTVSEIDGVTKWRCNTPYVSMGGSVNRTPNLTIRNVGTIDALVRVTMSLYYIDDYDNADTDTDKRPIIMTDSDTPIKGMAKVTATNWVYGFPSETVMSGYMYYGTKLAPYITRVPNTSGNGFVETPVSANNISVINSFVVSEEQKDTQFYIDITIDSVAYDGNIYKKIENGETQPADIPVYAYPFGLKTSLPSAWEAWK